MDKDLLTTGKGLMQTEDSEYVRLVSLISGVWDKAREKAALSVNTELLDASWETGRYQHEALLCAIPKNPDSVWTIDMEPLFGAIEVR